MKRKKLLIFMGILIILATMFTATGIYGTIKLSEEEVDLRGIERNLSEKQYTTVGISFYKNINIPIWIDSIKILEEGESNEEIFYVPNISEGIVMGPLTKKEFLSYYGQCPTLVTKKVDTFCNKQFGVFFLTQNTESKSFWVDITYRTWGIFKKQFSQEVKIVWKD